MNVWRPILHMCRCRQISEMKKFHNINTVYQCKFEWNVLQFLLSCRRQIFFFEGQHLVYGYLHETVKK